MLARRFVLIGLAAFGSACCIAEVDAASAAEVGSIDDDFLRQMRAITATSLLASRHVAPQLSVPKLRRFADLEVKEQETLWSSPDFPNASERPEDDRAPSDAELERHLVPLGRNKVANMRGTDAGTNLAREYFLLEIDVHQQLLRLQEDYLKLGRDPNLVGLAKRIDATTREHLRLLEDIKADVDSGKGMVRSGR